MSAYNCNNRMKLNDCNYNFVNILFTPFPLFDLFLHTRTNESVTCEDKRRFFDRIIPYFYNSCSFAVVEEERHIKATVISKLYFQTKAKMQTSSHSWLT